MNSPQTEEGWHALAVLDVCSSQVRALQGAVLGMDFNAWMSASQALDAEPAAMTHFFPAIEAGLTQALNKSSPDNPNG